MNVNDSSERSHRPAFVTPAFKLDDLLLCLKTNIDPRRKSTNLYERVGPPQMSHLLWNSQG